MTFAECGQYWFSSSSKFKTELKWLKSCEWKNQAKKEFKNSILVFVLKVHETLLASTFLQIKFSCEQWNSCCFDDSILGDGNFQTAAVGCLIWFSQKKTN